MKSGESRKSSYTQKEGAVPGLGTAPCIIVSSYTFVYNFRSNLPLLPLMKQTMQNLFPVVDKHGRHLIAVGLFVFVVKCGVNQKISVSLYFTFAS